jgi:hypothetical protein
MTLQAFWQWKFQMDICNPIATLLEIGVKFSKKQSLNLKKEESQMVNIPYSRVVGCLIYRMVVIRSDVATYCSGSCCSNFQQP